MKQVEGYSKEYYIEQCIREGGTPVEYENMEAAREAAHNILKDRGYDDPEVKEDDLKNGTNCDWVVMDDGTVIFRSYENRKTRKGET